MPALIAGFYALYLAKRSARWKRPALAGALACFVFVAYSWTELHELMQADAAWHDFYAGGERIFVGGDIAPRMIVWLGAMTALFAAVSAWSRNAPIRRLAGIALAGRALSIAGGAWLVRRGFAVDAALGWLLVAAVAVDVVGWIAVWRRPDGPGLVIATAGGAAALIAAVCVREAPRLAFVEPARGEPGGAVVFALALALGVAAIAWVVRVVRAGDRS